MTDKVKGWLMLSPFIIGYVAFMWYMAQWYGLLMCAIIPFSAYYFGKAIELINRSK